jgi:hypothetical protein
VKVDVFYYWKNIDTDLDKGRVGWLASERKKLGELQDRSPDHIWAFRTPKGRKGQLQVVARLLWLKEPARGVSPPEAKSCMYYDPSASTAVRFIGSDSDENIQIASAIIRRRFPSAFKSNFQGDNGVQVLENDLVRELDKFTKALGSVPLIS